MTYPRISCKNCENRNPTCHCACEEYKAYKKELEEYNAAVKKAKEQDRIMSNYIRDNYKKRVWKK